jgi:carboxyl-terminal processing protease
VESKQEAEIMAGNFEGIGIEFMISKDTIQVVVPIAGGPSEQAGLNAGDKIIKINDTTAAGVKITNEDVVKKLKGPKGTKVKVTVQKRNGQIADYTITRDKIPIYSVDAAFMLDGKTGLIKINRFSQNTYMEFAEKLDFLLSKGMKNLIIDLRGNGGGFLDQAVKVADELLDGKKLIVYTEGRNSPKTVQNAGKIGHFESGNLVILIDEGSASASEIVSGAIQDWDRGTIIGRRSFGKGLVQEEIPFKDGSAVRLTVAKYYTPSGRCIQKDYTNGTEAYYHELENRYKTGDTAAKSPTDDKQVFRTKIKNRIVYGGGGITPDIVVPIDTSMFNPLVMEILYNSLLNEYAYNYYQTNKQQFNYKDYVDFDKNYNISQELYQSFLEYAWQNGVTRKHSSYAEASKKYLSLRLKAYFARQQFQNDGFYYILSKDDKMIERAANLLISE